MSPSANFHSDDVVGIEIESMQEAFRIDGCSAPHVVKFGPLKKRAFATCKDGTIESDLHDVKAKNRTAIMKNAACIGTPR